MRTFKKMIPMAFVALAIAGALSTHAMSGSLKKTSDFQGYVKANPLGTICDTSIMCTDNPGDICTVGTTQIYGKDDSGKCVVELNRIP